MFLKLTVNNKRNNGVPVSALNIFLGKSGLSLSILPGWWQGSWAIGVPGMASEG